MFQTEDQNERGEGGGGGGGGALCTESQLPGCGSVLLFGACIVTCPLLTRCPMTYKQNEYTVKKTLKNSK